MPKERLYPKGMWRPSGSYSQVVTSEPGRMVFVAGQVAMDEVGKTIGIGDVRAQAKQALKNIIAGVEAAGGTKNDIVSMSVFTTDARYHPDVNAVRREVFGSDFPASTMVQVVALARPELLIEINATAVISK
jgi:2-iminobutanoate/2-iminopropanoate deaminase